MQMAKCKYKLQKHKRTHINGVTVSTVGTKTHHCTRMHFGWEISLCLHRIISQIAKIFMRIVYLCFSVRVCSTLLIVCIRTLHISIRFVYNMLVTQNNWNVLHFWFCLHTTTQRHNTPSPNPHPAHNNSSQFTINNRLVSLTEIRNY